MDNAVYKSTYHSSFRHCYRDNPQSYHKTSPFECTSCPPCKQSNLQCQKCSDLNIHFNKLLNQSISKLLLQKIKSVVTFAWSGLYTYVLYFKVHWGWNENWCHDYLKSKEHFNLGITIFNLNVVFLAKLHDLVKRSR